ncbi:hypothetical protein HZF08_29995 [Paenibacillus sp. CGMCC 1.16610]|uniref:Uncharacterized protein n=1 Tax=Paenibacillus anseongense TaxID=2682845 RepID=A0ABW9UBW5_9BACL|nr:MULTISPECIES: hypothetical protein [Paenibacillus]MBA2942511.1 hypothetical protein [Paenibacillus sp. CGMCC 1.16610]MVQ35325.1 hypothetical protein [Paenibacillus anseongense]
METHRKNTGYKLKALTSYLWGIQAQNENDLEMILYHCMNRWDSIEPRVGAVEAWMEKRMQAATCNLLWYLVSVLLG